MKTCAMSMLLPVPSGATANSLCLILFDQREAVHVHRIQKRARPVPSFVRLGTYCYYMKWANAAFWSTKIRLQRSPGLSFLCQDGATATYLLTAVRAIAIMAQAGHIRDSCVHTPWPSSSLHAFRQHHPRLDLSIWEAGLPPPSSTT